MLVGRAVTPGGSPSVDWDNYKLELAIPEGGKWAERLKLHAQGVLTSGGKTPAQIANALSECICPLITTLAVAPIPTLKSYPTGGSGPVPQVSRGTCCLALGTTLALP